MSFTEYQCFHCFEQFHAPNDISELLCPNCGAFLALLKPLNEKTDKTHGEPAHTPG